jgi:hypothetical protein
MCRVTAPDMIGARMTRGGRMARSIGNLIPAALVDVLSDDAFADWVGVNDTWLTILVLSTTHDAWPHLAMVSLGEIVAVSPRSLRLALWPNSTAATNVWRERRTTLVLIHEGAAYYLRCAVRRGADLVLPDAGGQLACFGLRVDDVIEDVAPYAVLTSGVTFRLNDPDVTAQRWRATRAALRRARFSGE